MTNRLQNVYFVTRDFARARQFYENTLGLAVKFADGERWLQFNAGGTNFSLSSVTEAPADVVGAVPVFEVDDIDRTAAQIEQAGGQIIGSRDMGAHGRSKTCRDTEGNIAQIFART